eukprot:gb/GECG01006021.1/.p1 GENE.gb/GECG01006021.1/~~gb/GECG01006021.1/.p1  ORF type:complete len:782 (+),score=101.25 gb/GECG01006021.1/:1-2346(+)
MLTVPELQSRCRKEGIKPVPKTKGKLIEALFNRKGSAGAGAAYPRSSVQSGKRLRGSDGNSDNESMADERSLPKHARGEIPPARHKLLEWLEERPRPGKPRWLKWPDFKRHFAVEPTLDFSAPPFVELEDLTEYLYGLIFDLKNPETGEEERGEPLPLTEDDINWAKGMARRAHSLAKKNREGVAGGGAASSFIGGAASSSSALLTPDDRQAIIAEVLDSLAQDPQLFEREDGSHVELPPHDGAISERGSEVHVKTITLPKMSVPKFIPFVVGHNVVLLRQATTELLEGFYEWIREYQESDSLEVPTNVFLTGTAGMGKSVLVWQLIQRVVYDERCVLYCTKDSDGKGEAFVIRRQEGQISVQCVNVEDIRRLGEQHLGAKVVQIMDGHHSTNMPEIAGVNSVCILYVSSIRDKIFKERSKKSDWTYFLPKFSKEETRVFAEVRSKYLPQPTLDEIMGRYEEVGGCPRFLTKGNTAYKKTLKEQEDAVKFLREASMDPDVLHDVTSTVASRFVVHIGARPTEYEDLNEHLQKYAVQTREIASGRVSRLMVLYYNLQMQKLGSMLTSIDTPARPYFFESVVIQFVQNGPTLSWMGRRRRRRQPWSLPKLKAILVLKESMKRAHTFELTVGQLCVPVERTFPVIDAWSAHYLVQVTVAKRHALDWTNPVFKNVLKQVRESRRQNSIEGNIPFYFFVPEGQTCKTVEKGTPPHDVEVYVVALSNLPDWTRAACEDVDPEEAAVQHESAHGFRTIYVTASECNTSTTREVLSAPWGEHSNVGHQF